MEVLGSTAFFYLFSLIHVTHVLYSVATSRVTPFKRLNHPDRRSGPVLITMAAAVPGGALVPVFPGRTAGPVRIVVVVAAVTVVVVAVALMPPTPLSDPPPPAFRYRRGRRHPLPSG
uniref:Uncharacterized protein n=1 Tax=Oryza sativa subsp. japonica TaxID=39947 RepID=Q69RF9_ORYSJ|nr:hypothetical protein [Oryza sativa Japonica Group]